MPTSIRLDPDLERQLEARARHEHLSKSALIHQALREFLRPANDLALKREAVRQAGLANKSDARDDWEAFAEW